MGKTGEGKVGVKSREIKITREKMGNKNWERIIERETHWKKKNEGKNCEGKLMKKWETSTNKIIIIVFGY